MKAGVRQIDPTRGPVAVTKSFNGLCSELDIKLCVDFEVGRLKRLQLQSPESKLQYTSSGVTTALESSTESASTSANVKNQDLSYDAAENELPKKIQNWLELWTELAKADCWIF